jgi:serine protease Do
MESEEPEKPEPSGAKFGLRIRPPNDTEREAAGIEKGVVISTVEEGSFAEEIGLQERDILVSINRQPVGSIDDIRGIQAKLKPGDAVAFRVMRPSPFAGRQGGRAGQYIGTYLAGTLPAN